MSKTRSLKSSPRLQHQARDVCKKITYSPRFKTAAKYRSSNTASTGHLPATDALYVYLKVVHKLITRFVTD